MDNIDANKIGICIPTYNRDKYLKQCLESIISEFKKFGFSIYVSDNCSDDDTNNVVNLYKQKYENLIYSRNLLNAGPYENILNSIKMAKTEYLWLMGDDDAILPESVHKIVEELDKEYDFLVFNAVPCDKDLEPKSTKKIIDIDKDMKLRRGDSPNLLVLLRKSSYHGYMSSMLIKTKLLQYLIPKYSDKFFSLYGSSWLPLAIFYEAIADKHGLFLAEPIILNRDNTRTSGKNYWNYIYTDHIKAIKYLESVGYDSKALKNSLNFRVKDTFHTAKLSKRLSPDVKLFDEFVKKDDLIPFYIKLTIILVDVMYAIHFISFWNKLKSKL